ncbi:MAG TPA: hypothetical protein VIK87_02120 [Sphingomonadales bacterium]
MTGAALDLSAIRAGGKAALARALALLEARPHDPAVMDLLDAAWNAPLGRVIGLTGPPGVGKSTLTAALIRAWRAEGRTVAVIAIDPSSRVSGGALLGDRIRLNTDPEDNGLFVRSMAARERLGGLADLTFPAMVLLRATHHMVLIETVGVGQSETEVAEAADTVVFCVQPGSGDSLQFMKAGIMEIPHVLAVTKADMGPVARRARADLKGALSLAETDDSWKVPVLLLSAATGAGIPDLVAAIDNHGDHLAQGGALNEARTGQGNAWLEAAIRARFGSEGLAAARAIHMGDMSPFASYGMLARRIRVIAS